MQAKRPGYFHIFEVPANGTRNAAPPVFYVYLLKGKKSGFKPFGGCGQLVAVKKVPKFAEGIRVGVQDDVEYVGFIKYAIEKNVAKTPGYNPKEKAANAPGIGSYLDLCISDHIEKAGLKYVQTSSAPSDSRIYQMQMGGLPLYRKIPIREYKLGIAKRVREKVDRFMGRKVEAEEIA